MRSIHVVRNRLGVLGERGFALVFCASLASGIGSAAVPVALSFALFARGAGAGRVSAVLAAEAVPMALLLLAGGVLADRFPPRRVMVAADLVRCGAQAVLFWLLLAGHASLVAVLVPTALVGIGTALDGPGRNRLLTQVVAPGRLQQANALLTTGASIGALLGPVLGGMLAAGIGGAGAIGLDSATYAISAALLLVLGIHARDGEYVQPATGGLLPVLLDGWTEFVRRPWIWQMVCLFGVLHMVSWGPVVVLGALGFAHRPHGALDWGLLLSLMGAGIVLGGLLALRLRPRSPIRTVLLWLLVYPLVPASLALGLALPLQGICFLLSGVEIAVVNVVWETTLQRTIPSDRLSRVSAFDQTGSLCLLPLGYVLAGPMAAWLGVAGALWSGAAIVLAFILLLLAQGGLDGAGA